MATEHKILIVEDSDEDFYTTTRAFEEAGIANGIDRCIDGEEAIAYLESNSDALPNIVLLDLNLPKLDGREVLRKMKQSEAWCELPVIVLTTSSATDDIKESYANGANSYIQKPVDLDNFIEAIKRLKDYWFEIVILPKRK